jgi:hypothetical protein
MTYNQYDQNQIIILSEAKKLAHSGEEYSHLIKLLNPEYSLRLKIYIQSLPYEIANKTIYGRTHWREQSLSQQKRRG